MADLKIAVSRLNHIFEAYSEEAQTRRIAALSIDDFTALKRKLHQDIRSVRKVPSPLGRY
jgi:hypothetical protein